MVERRRGRWASLGFFLVEALVVFLGVWSAFLLDGCREQQVADARREQIHEALRHDLSEIDESMLIARTWFDERFVDGFLTPLENGEQPMLQPIPLPTVPTDGSWNAILAAGGLDVLDLELIQAVESTIAVSAWLGETAREYNAYVRTVLVDELGETPDVSTFYDPDTGELRGKFLWYYHSLHSMREGFKMLDSELQTLRALVGPPEGDAAPNRGTETDTDAP